MYKDSRYSTRSHRAEVPPRPKPFLPSCPRSVFPGFPADIPRSFQSLFSACYWSQHGLALIPVGRVSTLVDVVKEFPHTWSIHALSQRTSTSIPSRITATAIGRAGTFAAVTVIRSGQARQPKPATQVRAILDGRLQLHAHDTFRLAVVCLSLECW